VGVDKVIPYVYLAQPFFIEPILGEPLMDELSEEINDKNISPQNQALLLKIAPVLALYTQYLAMRSLTYTILEKGITKLKSENSETLNDKELGEYINSTRENAEMAKDLLIKYLCGCRELYPLWRPSNECKCDKYFVNIEGSTDLGREFHIFFPKNKKGGCKCG
jgi:hypothetical protein